MALSDNIKIEREKKGYSQEFIADKLGVSRQAVSKWETGQTEPSTKNLLLLAEALEVDMNSLLVNDKEKNVFSKENIEQKGVRTILSKRNAILLTASCTAQMMIFCVNTGEINEFKYIMSGFSFVFMILLILNIWFTTERQNRNKLYLRIFWFVLAFQVILNLSTNYLGGLIALIISVIFVTSLLKVSKV